MKYIVEFEDEPCMYEDDVHFYKCIQAPWWGLSERVIKQLTPYQSDIAPDTNVGNITNSCDHEKDHTADSSKMVCVDAISRQETIDALDEQIENMPSAAPSTAHTTETTAPSTDDWIPVERELPEDLAEVNVTWVNHEPEPYYEPIKSKPFTASAVYYEGNWYWYSSVCADVLAEYGRNDVDKVDDAIEITAWRPLPEPYEEEGDT